MGAALAAISAASNPRQSAAASQGKTKTTVNLAATILSPNYSQSSDNLSSISGVHYSNISPKKFKTLNDRIIPDIQVELQNVRCIVKMLEVWGKAQSDFSLSQNYHLCETTDILLVCLEESISS